MAGAAAIAALVVDGEDVIGIGADIALVVAGSTLGVCGDLGECDMVDIAVARQIVVVADDTGGVNGTGLAVGDGSVDFTLQR